MEVDLEYPKELHDSHDDYPLAVEKIHVSQNMLSSCCERIRQKYNISIGQVKKASSNIINKNKLRALLQKPSIVYGLGITVEESP